VRHNNQVQVAAEIDTYHLQIRSAPFIRTIKTQEHRLCMVC